MNLETQHVEGGGGEVGHGGLERTVADEGTSRVHRAPKGVKCRRERGVDGATVDQHMARLRMTPVAPCITFHTSGPKTCISGQVDTLISVFIRLGALIKLTTPELISPIQPAIGTVPRASY